MLAVNDKCLAYHGPLLYEAKILQIFKDNQLQTKDATIQLNEELGSGKDMLLQPIPSNILGDKHNTAYFIHYKGWKSTWDEWVNDERILEMNNENFSLQKKLKDEILKNISKKNSENSAATSATTVSKKNGSNNDNSATASSTAFKSKRKRNYDESLQKLHDFYSKPEIHIILPNSLKSLLVQDWEQVTKNQLLIRVKSNEQDEKPSVYDILDDFQQWMIDNMKDSSAAHQLDDIGIDETILKEVINGLKKYFDVSLGSLLLYKFERGQYKKFIHDEKHQTDVEPSPMPKRRRKSQARGETEESPIQNNDNNTNLSIQPGRIYGFQHLLRLLSIIPNLIAQTNMDQVSVGILKSYLDQLVLFLSSNSKDFLMEYENVSPSYESLNKL